MQEQMQRPEVQEQMKEAQALMQDKGFAEKVEKLKVSWLAANTDHVACMLRVQSSCYVIALPLGDVQCACYIGAAFQCGVSGCLAVQSAPPQQSSMQYMGIFTHY